MPRHPSNSKHNKTTIRKNKLNEIWRPVVGWEGKYEVSNFGRIKTIERIRKLGESDIVVIGRIKALVTRKDGYISVTLGRTKTHLVHRIVSQAFLPNPNNYPTVNHKDWRKNNNHVDNLEWCTRKHNSQHAYMNPITKASAKSRLKLEKANESWLSRCCGINVYRGGKFVKYFERMSDLKAGLKIKNESNVYTVMKGKGKSYLGYTFEKVIKINEP